MEIPKFIIPLDEFKTSRGRNCLVFVHGDSEAMKGKYLPSTIRGVKSPRLTFDDDEYYLFRSKSLGLFMLEKTIIYECNIDCSQWGDLIAI